MTKKTIHWKQPPYPPPDQLVEEIWHFFYKKPPLLVFVFLISYSMPASIVRPLFQHISKYFLDHTVCIYIYIYIYISNIQSASKDNGCGLFACRIYEEFHINLWKGSMYGYCDMVCYREREGKVNSLTLLYLNQQALRLTVKTVWERRSSNPHSVTCSLFNERSLGQLSNVTWRGSGRGKVEWLAHRLFAPKCHYPLEKFEEESLVFGQKSARATHWYLPTSGRSLTHKKERKKSEHWKPVKDKYNFNRFPSTIPKYWKVICIQKRKRVTEKILFHQ